MEALQTDAASESLGAHRFVEDLTTATDGIGGGERSVATASEASEMLGATANLASSLGAEAGATSAMPMFEGWRSSSLVERAAALEGPHSEVGRFV